MLMAQSICGRPTAAWKAQVIMFKKAKKTSMAENAVVDNRKRKTQVLWYR